MRRFFGRMFSSAPAWLALMLVLGGTALATAPVFNGSVKVPVGGSIDATNAPITDASGGISNPQPWATPMPANQTLVIWGDSIAEGVGATSCAGTGGHQYVAVAPPGGTCWADKVATYFSFAFEQDDGIGGATLEHNGSTQSQWIDFYNVNTQGTTTAAITSTGSQAVSVSLTSGSIVNTEPVWVNYGQSDQEVVIATASSTTSLTANFTKTHASGVTISAAACLTCVAGPNTWFVSQVGTNDDGVSQFSPATFTANYETIINALIAAGTPASHIILNGVLWNTQPPAFTSAWTAAAMKAALVTHVRFANTWAAMAPYNGTDWTGGGSWPYLYYGDSLGLHPNDNGSTLIANEIETNASYISASNVSAMNAISASFSTNPWNINYGTGGGQTLSAFTAKVNIGVGVAAQNGDLGIGMTNGSGEIQFGGPTGSTFGYYSGVWQWENASNGTPLATLSTDAAGGDMKFCAKTGFVSPTSSCMTFGAQGYGVYWPAWYFDQAIVSADNFYGNASTAAPSPAPSGYKGPAVIAQATAAPTMQPGYIQTTNFQSGGGAPSGSCTPGSLYIRTDTSAAAGSEAYVCRNVSGTGTWEALSGG